MLAQLSENVAHSILSGTKPRTSTHDDTDTDPVRDRLEAPGTGTGTGIGIGIEAATTETYPTVKILSGSQAGTNSTESLINGEKNYLRASQNSLGDGGKSESFTRMDNVVGGGDSGSANNNGSVSGDGSGSGSGSLENQQRVRGRGNRRNQRRKRAAQSPVVGENLPTTTA